MSPAILERPISKTIPKTTLGFSVRLFTSQPEDGKLWDDFVQSHPEATSEHLWAWRTIIRRSFNYQPFYLAAIEDRKVVGILPLFKIPRGVGHALSSIPFGNYAGVCAQREDIENALMHAAKKMTRLAKAKYLELHHKKASADLDLKLCDRYARFYRVLSTDANTAMNQIGTKIRNKIKKAMTSGLRVEASRNPDILYQIHLHTTHRQGTPCFPKVYFEEILNQFGPESEIHYVYKEQQPIAYMMVLYFKKTIVTQFNGSLTEFMKLKPNNLLYWHQVENGESRGMTEVDHGRSRKDSGSAGFKRQMHLTEEALEYQFYLPQGQPMPSHNPSNPKYKFMIQSWQKLPASWAAFFGPKIVRYLA